MSFVIVPLYAGSDGDATHVPPAGNHVQVDPPALYLEKIGQQWMESRGEARPGVKYILERLPTGYSMWQRPRPTNAKLVDKYLYGHPNHKKFDSPNRYYPHFQHLMDNGGDSMGCPCTVCAGSSGILPKSSSSSVQMHSSSAASSRPPTPRVPQSPPPMAPSAHVKGRPKTISAGLDTSRVDEEGTPDVYRNLVDKLRRYTTIDEVIEEPLSPDWRAEQDILPSWLNNLREREQWMPRVGDIVLYIRELPDRVKIVRHDVTAELQLYNEQSETFLGPPPWEAGLVGEVPKAATVHDLTEVDSKTSIVTSGVRVEPIPDANNEDKSLSKRHKYVSLRQIRPLVLWQELLHHVPRENWDATVVNALSLASTCSLMGKHRFRGTWPNANIYCHGLYLGSELLAVGDAVRLLPNSKSGQPGCSEILIIKSLRLKWSNMDMASNNDYDEGRPYDSAIWIYGTAYTNDPTRSNKEWLSEQNVELPKLAQEYSSWYPLHPSNKELALPLSRILGRLYEPDAMAIWLNSEPDDPPDLDVGREGLLEARAFSRKRDQRIAQNANATWYWGDNRADALNLHTINGLEVAKYDRERDVRQWRKDIKLIEGMNDKATATMKPEASTSAGGRGLRSFMAPGTASLPVRTHSTGEASDLSSSTVGGTSSSEGKSPAPGKKKRRVFYLSEDEDEIRHNTKVVDEASGTPKKKAKVMVVID
ncbi:uncharacterized protein K460DRAFT_362295 [Cucurbitaria berberidis CBS 394.84]|uniref:Cryptic loci regulator 2 N-terminal domain-containing protein n=1 Tax=Cucurbitaria berberidis CBS 394.84 TaxID=1168544 RepID=A0A9P4LD73_9PLEO|nr:uncharacterized protein K460DRAFT_362295 [Cucurbitaria berberidis CBS 394.84]KAF1851541.1 hypothetical protein K460DRAFT_362295 [Cucurbitaria berberidis CBS 394.84]